MALKFYPANHNRLIICLAQIINLIELATEIKLNVIPAEIKTLSSFKLNSGLILVANHSDELDIRLCMELSRLCARRFTYMINTEAFEEYSGLAAWFLQRLGSFSIERGAADQEAIRYAVDTVKKSTDVLVIFPEGEIYNLNDSVQIFKTGVVHIGMQAIKEMQTTNPNWTSYILPIAIKYHYPKNIAAVLKKRINKMERHLAMRSNVLGFKNKLYRIMNKLQSKTKGVNKAEVDTKKVDALVDELQLTRDTVVSKIEKKYLNQTKVKGNLLSRAQKMIFFLREQISKKKFFTEETHIQLENDLKAIKDTIQMATWQPKYIELNPSEERLAETVMKLERVVFNKKRPSSLGKREVFIRLLEPMNLSDSLVLYEEDPSSTSKDIVEELRNRIQAKISI